MKIKRGQIVALTRGRTSDYEIVDYYKARRDFDTEELVRRFKAEGPYRVMQKWGEGVEVNAHGSDRRFIAWLISEFYLRPMEPGQITEWLIGEHDEVIESKEA